MHWRAKAPHPPHSSNIIDRATAQYNDDQTAQESKLITIVIFLFHLGVLQKTSFIHCSARCCCVASNATHRGIKVFWCCLASNNVTILQRFLVLSICEGLMVMISFFVFFFFLKSGQPIVYFSPGNPYWGKLGLLGVAYNAVFLQLYSRLGHDFLSIEPNKSILRCCRMV